VSLVHLVQQLSQLRHLTADSAHLCQVVYSTNMPKERGVLGRSFHVRKNNERVLNARSVRNEQNVPNVRSNYEFIVEYVVSERYSNSFSRKTPW